MGLGKDKKEEFKKRLLSALEDDEIKEKICQILKKQSEESTSTQIPSDLLLHIDEQQVGVEQLTAENNALKNQLEQKQHELVQIQQNVKAKKDRLIQADKQISILQSQLDEKERIQQQRQQAWETERQTYQEKLAYAERLTARCDDLKRLLDEKNHKQAELLQQLQDIKDAGEKSRIQLLHVQQEAGKLTAVFAELLDMYQQVKTLPEEQKKKLQPILGLQNPTCFLIYTSHCENMTALWEYMKGIMSHCREEEKEVLLHLLRYCVHNVNLLYETPVYQLMDEETGQNFDDMRHSRAAGSSNYSGPVREIILPGICNCRTQKVIYKSLVRV